MNELKEKYSNLSLLRERAIEQGNVKLAKYLDKKLTDIKISLQMEENVINDRSVGLREEQYKDYMEAQPTEEPYYDRGV